MHDGQTNRLTQAVFDPESRQPAYKACAARVRAAELDAAAPAARPIASFPQTATMGSPLE
jgi:hypothetical protein